MATNNWVGAGALAMLMFGAGAQAESGESNNAYGDIAGRWYISPMASMTDADGRRQTDDGSGWSVAIGKNVNRYFNFEIYGFQTDFDALDGGSAEGRFDGFGIGAYGFPFGQRDDGLGSVLGGAYGLIGVGYGESRDFPLRDGLFDSNGSGFMVDAGIGYLLRIPFIRLASLRLDARYRLHMDRHPYASVDPDTENDNPEFGDVVLSAGLLIPIGALPPPPAPPPVAAVVPVAAACADGLDNDGDGLVDFPSDPGCASSDDNDETDLPQCSDGLDNDGDGLIDFPSDPGCLAADDNDESDPCRSPEAGENLSLRGCGPGDVIVLRGVNFEFNESRLTAEARSLLDQVSAELAAYPAMHIELRGHTDARGDDAYNQRLSETRAAEVVDFLQAAGIAAERMAAVGYGESQPLADNDTDEGRDRNRRVELVITGASD